MSIPQLLPSPRNNQARIEVTPNSWTFQLLGVLFFPIWEVEYKLAQDIQIYPLSKRDDNDIRTLKYIHICDETFIETIRR